ncbi:hypothetical protein BM1_07616 [Bipolaris maydis]|nr:hypothetical protein BM1_07616 [Bipolaris maydis]
MASEGELGRRREWQELVLWSEMRRRGEGRANGVAGEAKSGYATAKGKPAAAPAATAVVLACWRTQWGNG